MLHWGFPPIIGGVETHLSLLGPQLTKQGYFVTLLTGSVDNQRADYQYKGIEIKRSPLFDLNWLSARGFDGLDQEIQDLIYFFLDKSKPDIIHAHNMHYFSKIHAAALWQYAKKNNIPLLLTVHNIWDDSDFLNLTRNAGWKHIIAVSNYIKFELTGIGLPANKVTVVHHGIDTTKFKKTNNKEILDQYPILRNRKIIFHPARISLAKGCDIAIKALRLIKQSVPEALLVLAGTKNIIDWGTKQQKEIAYILELAKKLNLQDSLFMRMIPLELMPEFYNLADVSIYPSTAPEPSGMVVLESLASATPIIITNSGGMPEVVRDGVNGFSINVRDYQQLAQHCTTILKDSRMKKLLGENGRRLIKKCYNKEIMINNTIEVYHKVLNSK